MAQHDYNIANQSFPSFRSDLNNALSAIQTTNSGTSRPTGAVAGQIWLDTTSATSPTLKFFDGADDISLATINYTANTVDWLDSSVTITGLSTSATGTVLTLSDSASTSSVNLIIDNQKEVRFRETTANGTNYIGLKAPASLSADLTFVLPSTDGTSGQFLKTDGAGNLSFASLSFATPLTVIGNSTAGSSIRLPEDTDNGSNYVALKAPDSLSSDLTFTLPSADGTSGQVLQTNGSGVLSFSSPSSDFVLLATTTASNAASISLDGYFSSTYRVYYLHVLDYYGSTSANLYVRFRRSNSDITTSNYTYASAEAYRSVGGGGQDYFNGWNAAFGRLTYNGFSSTQGFSNTILTFYNPSDSTSYKTCQVNSISSVSTGDEIANNNGFVQLRDNTNALSGVTVYASTGNIYGTLKLYGVK